MIRLLGVITGSILAVATLLLVIGMPRFQTETAEGERTPVRLPRPTLPVEEPRPAAGADDASEDSAVADTGTAAPDADSSGEAAADGAGDLPPAQTSATTADAVPAPVESWHVFWSPFKSRIAAEGFVARLQSVTGLDYRIVKREPGAYEVSFAYADGDELDRHLSQISAATGLDLAEAR